MSSTHTSYFIPSTNRIACSMRFILAAETWPQQLSSSVSPGVPTEFPARSVNAVAMRVWPSGSRHTSLIRKVWPIFPDARLNIAITHQRNAISSTPASTRQGWRLQACTILVRMFCMRIPSEDYNMIRREPRGRDAHDTACAGRARYGRTINSYAPPPIVMVISLPERSTPVTPATGVKAPSCQITRPRSLIVGFAGFGDSTIVACVP